MTATPDPFAVNRVRDRLMGVESDDLDAPVRIRAGVVTALSKATTPWTVTVRFADGTSTGAIAAMGWYDPVVNDPVMVLQQGPANVCMGGFAGAAKVVSTTVTVVTPPTPPTPPAPPAAAPTVRTVNLASNSTACWSPSWGGWRTDNDDPRQTGTSAQRGFWFYGSQIATAKGAGTITAATVYITRRNSSHGVGGAANVRLGLHSFGTLPGSGASALANVAVRGALSRGQDATIALDAGQIAALNAGAAGIGLEPGVGGTSSTDYLIALGKGSLAASGQLQLTITG